jgi:hypothetical protein
MKSMVPLFLFMEESVKDESSVGTVKSSRPGVALKCMDM